MRTKLNSMNAICGADAIVADATRVRLFDLIPALKRRAKLIPTLRVEISYRWDGHAINFEGRNSPGMNSVLFSNLLRALSFILRLRVKRSPQNTFHAKTLRRSEAPKTN